MNHAMAVSGLLGRGVLQAVAFQRIPWSRHLTTAAPHSEGFRRRSSYFDSPVEPYDERPDWRGSRPGPPDTYRDRGQGYKGERNDGPPSRYKRGSRDNRYTDRPPRRSNGYSGARQSSPGGELDLEGNEFLPLSLPRPAFVTKQVSSPKQA